MNTVLFEEKLCSNGMKLGVATLNSPDTLNSLTLEMISLLQKQFDTWAIDSGTALIFLKGAGEKAFCAGGDIRRLYQAIRDNTLERAEDFFAQEYHLNHWIHTCPKPVIVWGNGVVMGGGVGLMAGADFRIVTETAKLAMPEITIGFYPDVGGSYFLNQMPHHFGLFLALTGTRMNARDAIDLGLADLAIPQSKLESILALLSLMPWTQDPSVNKNLIRSELEKIRFSEQIPKSELLQHQKSVEKAMNGDTLMEVLASFKKVAASNPWMRKAFTALSEGSPTSAFVIFEQLRRCAGGDLREIFRKELKLSAQFLRHHDLAEGIRALLIDKDGKPQWDPSSFEEVTPACVEDHFR